MKNGVVNVSLHRAELRPVLVAGDDERNSIRANEITVTLQWSLSVLHSLLPSQTSQSAAFPENPGTDKMCYTVHAYEWDGCAHYLRFSTYSLTLTRAVVQTMWLCFCTDHHYAPLYTTTPPTKLVHHMLERTRLINHFHLYIAQCDILVELIKCIINVSFYLHNSEKKTINV